MNKTLVTLIIFSLITLPILACDMFLLQSIDNYPFFTLPSSSGNFNDYSDFFEDFKSQANQSSGNRDGYGIVAYKIDNPFLDRDFMWYKTGMGNYFEENNIDEPLYEAINTLYDNPNINRVLVHARSGTGGEGSHPFIFSTTSASYSFMHNGYIFNTVKQEIMDFLGEEWFQEHPSQWQGEFGSVSSFIDSELLFHYFMYYILQYPNDIPTAFRYAFNNKQVGTIDMEYLLKYNNNAITNFIFSDGVDSYAYRSSRIIGESYNLSYQIYPNNFIALKTGSNLANTLVEDHLIHITSEGDIIDLSLEPILLTNFTNLFVDAIDSNRYNLNWTIQSDNLISSFNIYRSTSENFATARRIASLEGVNPNQSAYQYEDSYLSDQVIYYWIEVVFQDASSEITSRIPSIQIDDEPEIPEVIDNIDLYPNPFQDKLNINIDSEQNYSVKVFNLRGQLLDKLTYLPKEDKTLSWDTSNQNKRITNGIYLIQFKHNGKTITKKVMRIK